MLKQFAQRHNLVLKKGQNFHILFTLGINYLLLLKLKLYKWIKGIHHPIVHYYAVCWNEEKMLPFMFDYYDQFVDHYTIYDNYSTDHTEEIIHGHKNTEIIKFSMNGQINDFIYQDIKNNCWKKSRGKSDFVVVCDIDEFIYHPRMNDILVEKNTLFHPEGCDMISQEFPKYGESLISQVRKGNYKAAYSKCILFNPYKIVEINYVPGAHDCSPCGIVRMYYDESLKLLHYKNLGIGYVLDRIGQYRERQSEENIKNHCAEHYQYSEGRIKHEFEENINSAKELI